MRKAGTGKPGTLPRRLTLTIASLTDPIVDFAVDVVDAMGLAGVFVLMLLESACIPIPSEATMLFAGFRVAEGEYSLFAAVMVGIGREPRRARGSRTALGYYGRVDILEKHGKKLHMKKSHLEWADRWFERHGDATVFFTRMLPIIRTFISLPAGVARMPFWRFSAAHVPRLHAVGLHAHVHRQGGRRALGRLEGLAPLRRLRRRRDDRDRHRVPPDPPPGRSTGLGIPPDASQGRSCWGSSRGPPRCCRSRALATWCCLGLATTRPSRCSLHAGTAAALLVTPAAPRASGR